MYTEVDHLLIGRSVVQLPASLVLMLKCLWARNRTLSDPQCIHEEEC